MQGEKPQSGWLKRWTLMFHGTKEAPYAGIEPLEGHVNSKLEVGDVPLTRATDWELLHFHSAQYRRRSFSSRSSARRTSACRCNSTHSGRRSEFRL